MLFNDLEPPYSGSRREGKKYQRIQKVLPSGCLQRDGKASGSPEP